MKEKVCVRKREERDREGLGKIDNEREEKRVREKEK